MYLIFCIFSFNLFTVRKVFLLHAVILFACCFTLVCRNKSPTWLKLHVCEYSTNNKISMSMSMRQPAPQRIIHTCIYDLNVLYIISDMYIRLEQYRFPISETSAIGEAHDRTRKASDLTTAPRRFFIADH